MGKTVPVSSSYPSALLEQIVNLVFEVSHQVKAIYDSGDIGEESKSDGSPITRADRLADRLLQAELNKLPGGYPVISEESSAPDFQTRAGWPALWMVDPLDGTRDFVKRTGDFTINVALIKEGHPVLGVIGAPVQGRVWSAEKDKGAYLSHEGKVQKISNQNREGPLVALVSRFHQSESLGTHLKNLGVEETIPAGSAVKFAYMAEGRADLYARLGPTMEWDIAAGHVIVNEAGCTMTQPDGQPLGYNKEILKNPGFEVRSTRLPRK